MTNQSYSREYVNELKRIFQKEKEELVYKNQILSNNVEKIKYQLSQEISSLHGKLEEARATSKEVISVAEEEYELKLRQTVNNKDMQVQSVLQEINKMQEELQRRESENGNLKREVERLRSAVSDSRVEGDKKLLVKDEELHSLKRFYEERMAAMADEFAMQKEEIIRSYEDNAEKLPFNENEHRTPNVKRKAD